MSHCLVKTNLGMSNLGNNSYKDKQASFWKKNAKIVPGKLVFFFWQKFFFLPSSSWLVTYQDAHKNDEWCTKYHVEVIIFLLVHYANGAKFQGGKRFQSKFGVGCVWKKPGLM